MFASSSYLQGPILTLQDFKMRGISKLLSFDYIQTDVSQEERFKPLGS